MADGPQIIPENDPPPRHYYVRLDDGTHLEERGPFRTVEDAQECQKQWVRELRIRRMFWAPYERALQKRHVKKLLHVPKSKRDPKRLEQIRSELQGFTPPPRPLPPPRDPVDGDCWSQFSQGTLPQGTVTAWQADASKRANAYRRANTARQRQRNATKQALAAKKKSKQATDDAIEREWEAEGKKGTPWRNRARNIASTLGITERRVRKTTIKYKKFRR